MFFRISQNCEHGFRLNFLYGKGGHPTLFWNKEKGGFLDEIGIWPLKIGGVGDKHPTTPTTPSVVMCVCELEPDLYCCCNVCLWKVEYHRWSLVWVAGTLPSLVTNTLPYSTTWLVIIARSLNLRARRNRQRLPRCVNDYRHRLMRPG